MKGFDQPVGVWSLRAIAADADAARSPFIGREAERAQFKGLLAACLGGKSGQAIYIRGDPGIGKTRLVAEMTSLATASGCAVHRALTLDFGTGSGQDPTRTLVRGLIGVPEGSDTTARQSAADAAIAHGLVPPAYAAFLHDLLGLSLPPSLLGLYEAMDNAARNDGKRALLSALVEAASRLQPRLIVVEDLHWADPLTLLSLAAIAAAVPAGPALLVMTSRREGDRLDAAWRARCADAPLTTIDLGPLRRSEALAFAGGYLVASHRRALECVDRAGGNPLFLEQLLRHAEADADNAVPPSIRSLVLARMDRLPPPDRRALQAASVAGQRVALDMLRHLVAMPDYDCAGLIEHALLRPEGDAFLFAHALVQEGVYASLLKPRRQALHPARGRVVHGSATRRFTPSI